MRWQFFLCLTIICLGFIRSKSIPDFHKDQWKKFKVDLQKKNYGSDEAKEIYGNVQQIDQRRLYSSMKDEPMYLELPKGRDWRSKNAVTKVKDQGITCYEGDWAFAAIGALEGLLARMYHNLTELSEQELIDCTKTRGNYGCEGGTVEKAFDYINEHGVWTEKSYPYTGMDETVCANKPEEKIAEDLKINLDIITAGDELQMKQKLHLHGPILAIIDASQESFLKYPGGIYHDDKCAKHGKHNVLIVGYGETEQKEKYWIVKNSWGEDWGEKGYIRIARDNNNTCGIATNATFITLK